MASPDQPVSPLTPENKKKLLHRLARAEGQLRGVQKMIGRGDDCELIARQLAAARAALNKAFFEMMACYFERWVAETADEAPVVREELSEFVSLLTKYA